MRGSVVWLAEAGAEELDAELPWEADPCAAELCAALESSSAQTGLAAMTDALIDNRR